MWVSPMVCFNKSMGMLKMRHREITTLISNKMNEAQKYILIRQPYGGAIIDQRAKVHFLNETATDIVKALVDRYTLKQIAQQLASNYMITLDQAEMDIKEFIHDSSIYYLLNSTDFQNWTIIGSDHFTSIVQADICLTKRCNLRCSYCYAEGGNNKNGDILVDQWVETIKKLVHFGMRKATIAGGEPLLSDALFPVLETLAKNDVKTQLFTNGLLINNSVVERLKNIPLNFVQISLDSTNEKQHNRYRGNSYSYALKAINLLVNSGISVVIGANIFPDTIDEICRLAELADSIGASLRCNPIEARGRGANFDENDTVVNESLTKSITKTIQNVSEKYSNVFADHEIQYTLESDERICPFSKGCIAVTELAEIRPCSQTDSFFKSVAPWAIDHRKVLDYSNSIEDHIAFNIISNIKPEVCPTRETCGICNNYPKCAGCLLAGYTCKERRLFCEEKKDVFKA